MIGPLLFALTVNLSSSTPVHRLALVAGNNDGGRDRVQLQYAVDDAVRFGRVMVELGGVRAEDAVVLVEPNRARLEQSLAYLTSQARKARAANERVEVVFYYSGHSDSDGLLLGDVPFSYRALKAQVDAIPADVRVVVLDSCASGAFTRQKGGTHMPAFLLDEGSRVRGHAFLTSSAAEESSQESDLIRSSFFTHALVSALRGAGDANRDGRVSLTEAYQFSFRETLARTSRTTAGGQHPTFAIDLAGVGDLVLTELRNGTASLVVPATIAGHVSVRDAEGNLTAEFQHLAGRETTLAVAPGVYRVFVDVDGPSHRVAGDVVVAAASRAVVDVSSLGAVDAEPVMLRGPTADDLSRREQNRLDVAQRAYATSKLRVGPITNRLYAYVGESTVPLEPGDLYARLNRPDLVARYHEAQTMQLGLIFGGLGVSLASQAAFLGGTFSGAFDTLTDAQFVIALSSWAAASLGGLATGLVAQAWQPLPLSVEETRALVDQHNAALRTQLGLPLEGPQP
jgi:hypothetical protein